MFPSGIKEGCFVLHQLSTLITQEPDGNVPELDPRYEGDQLTDFEFSVEDVREQLLKLKPEKSPGTDSIHPHVLRACADELALPLYIIYRKSLDKGELPRDWKRARVVPIYKKGANKSPGNYRPVSLRVVEWVALIRFLFGMCYY